MRESLYQEDVAKIIGIDRTTYISYENGLRIYPIEVMTKLSDMYNVDLDVLLDDYGQQVINSKIYTFVVDKFKSIIYNKNRKRAKP